MTKLAPDSQLTTPLAKRMRLVTSRYPQYTVSETSDADSHLAKQPQSALSSLVDETDQDPSNLTTTAPAGRIPHSSVPLTVESLNLAPAIFTTYHTLMSVGTPDGLLWNVVSSRTIYKHEAGPPVTRRGRSIPPGIDHEEWNVWTVGNLELNWGRGGLSKSYFQEALRRIDGRMRTKVTVTCLQEKVVEARELQVDEGFIIDRPVNWSPNNGWWVYVEPM